MSPLLTNSFGFVRTVRRNLSKLSLCSATMLPARPHATANITRCSNIMETTGAIPDVARLVKTSGGGNRSRKVDIAVFSARAASAACPVATSAAVKPVVLRDALCTRSLLAAFAASYCSWIFFCMAISATLSFVNAMRSETAASSI